MPMTYTIDASRNLITAVATGVLTDAEVMTHRSAPTSDRRFSTGMRELSDLRKVTDFRVTAAGIHNMVAGDMRMVPAGGMHPLAIVAGDDIAYGMSRMYQTLGEPHIRSVGVFRRYEDAAAWLGIA
jgi:hypothetical protein